MPNRAVERPEAIRNAMKRNNQMNRQLSNMRLNVEKDRSEIQRSFNNSNSKLLARLNALQVGTGWVKVLAAHTTPRGEGPQGVGLQA